MQFWHWWIFGLALLILELTAPGAFFLWIGLSALLAGAALWLVPALPWMGQVVLFAVLAVGLTWISRRWRAHETRVPAATPLNDRASLYLGRVFTLEAPIVDGVGQLRVDDGQWRAVGEDLPAGSRVRVIGVDGATLRVEKLLAPPAVSGAA